MRMATRKGIDQSAITWEEAFGALRRLLPDIPGWVSEPDKFRYTPIAACATRMGLVVSWEKMPEWDGYDYGFTNYRESELLGSLFRERPLPQGEAIFIPDDPEPPLGWMIPERLIEARQPYRIDVSELLWFVDTYPSGQFRSKGEFLIIFEAVSVITLFTHHGCYAHIDCNAEAPS